MTDDRDSLDDAAFGEVLEPFETMDAAQILGIHPVTARRWAKQGMFRPIRLTARRVRYDLNEVRRLSSEGVEVEPPGSRKGISC